MSGRENILKMGDDKGAQTIAEVQLLTQNTKRVTTYPPPGGVYQRTQIPLNGCLWLWPGRPNPPKQTPPGWYWYKRDINEHTHPGGIVVATHSKLEPHPGGIHFKRTPPGGIDFKILESYPQEHIHLLCGVYPDISETHYALRGWVKRHKWWASSQPLDQPGPCWRNAQSYDGGDNASVLPPPWCERYLMVDRLVYVPACWRVRPDCEYPQNPLMFCFVRNQQIHQCRNSGTVTVLRPWAIGLPFWCSGLGICTSAIGFWFRKG